jgi:hypothetical protein
LGQVPKEPHDKWIFCVQTSGGDSHTPSPQKDGLKYFKHRFGETYHVYQCFAPLALITGTNLRSRGNGFDVTIATHCKAADDRPSSQFAQEIHRSTQKLSFPTQKLSPNYFWGFNLFAGKAVSEPPNVLCEEIEHGHPEHKDSGRPAKTHRTHTHTT